MTFQSVIEEHFPGTVTEQAFVEGTLTKLEPHGFDADNAIACVGICRDELCRSLEAKVFDAWGEAFNFSSLAGMLFLGKTGFGAAHAHAPVFGGKERYVYFSLTHIGIGAGGEVGQCERPGRVAKSTACGALAALLGEMQEGQVDARRSPDDVEQSLLKELLLSRLAWGDTPDLVRLTKVAREAALDTLERMISLTVDPDQADYAVFSGVQIHGPENAAHVWPAKAYAVVGGKQVEL